MNIGNDVKLYMGVFVAIVLIYVAAFFNYPFFVSYSYEDGLFENLGALGFLATSIILLVRFKPKKNIFLIGLAIIFFFGFGEEISWGQRIFGIETPASLKESNIKGEINLHNLDIFHRRAGGKEKSGLALLLSVEMMFNFFWFGLCLVIPVVNRYVPPVRTILQKLKFPVGPISIGLLFLSNYVLFKTCAVTHPGVEGLMIPARGFGEIKETMYGLLFVLFALKVSAEERSKPIV